MGGRWVEGIRGPGERRRGGDKEREREREGRC